MPLATGLAAQIRQGLKGLEIVRTAVGIPRVVHRIDPQHQAFGAAGLRQAEADGDEHRVASRDIGRRNHTGLHPLAGDRLIEVCQRGATPGGQVDGDLVVFRQLQLFRDLGRGVQFAAMTLAVVEGQPDHAVTVLPGQRCSRG